MLKRQYLIAFAVVVALVLALLNLSERTAARLKFAVSSLFLPLFGLAGSTQNLTDRLGSNAVPRRVLLRELEQLREENKRLHAELVQRKEALQENERLRQMLGFQQRARGQFKAANVIGRDPANWWRTVQIDLGSRDGVRVDLPVRTNDGLVGRIAAVGYAQSQVLLVGDPNCRVAALIQESRESGIIVSSSAGSFDHRFADLTYLSSASRLRAGQTVVTSGVDGGIFPKGIPIGEIVDFRTVDYGLRVEARVKLAVDFSKLEEVWVMFP